MDKNDILQSIQEARKNAKKRKFVQTVDFILNFKGLTSRKTDRFLYICSSYERGKKFAHTTLVGQNYPQKQSSM